MAGRPVKRTVDWFPHQCRHGKTMQILKARFGNDGRAFWWTLLESLGSAPGHVYDCSNTVNWEYLVSEALVDPEKAEKILDMLVRLDAIDSDLWRNHRVIWCQNFVNNLAELYRRRNIDIPNPPKFTHNVISDGRNTINDGRNHQSRVEKIREEKNTPPLPPSPGGNDVCVSRDDTTVIFDGKNADARNGMKPMPDYMSAEYQALRKIGKEILSYLNKVAKKNFPDSYFGFTEIMKRLHDGRPYEDFISIIDKKLKDPKYNRNWLRPETLFSEQNFDKYLYEEEEQYADNDRCHDGRGKGNGRPGNGMFRDSSGRVDKTRFSVDGDIPEPVDFVFKPDTSGVS